LTIKAGANLLYFAAVFGRFFEACDTTQQPYQKLCVLIVAYFPLHRSICSSTKQNAALNEPNFPHSLKHGPDPVKDTHSLAQQAKQEGFGRCILGEISGHPENTCNDHRP